MLFMSVNPFESGIKGRPVQFYTMTKVKIDEVTKKLFEVMNVAIYMEHVEYPKIKILLKEANLPSEGACNIGHDLSASLLSINNLSHWLYHLQHRLIPQLMEFHHILGEYKIDTVKKVYKFYYKFF